MKKLPFFIIFYLIIFAVGGYFLYSKYLVKFIFKDALQTAGTVSDKGNFIYYTYDNNLYRIDADYILSKTQSNIPEVRLQSTGQVLKIAVSSQSDIFYYEVVTPEEKSQIWKVNKKDNTSEKLFSNETPGFEKTEGLREITLSSDKKYLAFLTAIEGKDFLFAWDTDTKVLTNLNKEQNSKITAFNWLYGKQELLYAENGNILKQTDVNGNEKTLWKGDGQILELETTKDKAIFSIESQNTVNLNSIDLQSGKIEQITAIKQPKKVTNFQLSQDGNKVVYESFNSQTQRSDLFLIGSNGKNLLQLTDDGNSTKGVFSPNGKEIAFWVKQQGIYRMKVDKTSKRKILNENSKIGKLLIWR